MLEQKDLDALKEKHGRIKHIIAADRSWEVVLRKPNRTEYKRFRSQSHNAARVADAQEDMVIATVVHPSREVLQALLEDYPGIPEACGSAITELAGMSAETDVKISASSSSANDATRTT